jgi:predicted PurR-regulated permease PerM
MSVPKRSRLLHVMLLCACFVVIVAGMRAAASILVPFLLALFTAVIVTPWYINLQQKAGLPGWAALLILAVLLVMLGGVCLIVLGTSLTAFASDLTTYQQGLESYTDRADAWLTARGVEDSEEFLLTAVDPQAAMRLVGRTVMNLSDLLGTTFVIILIVVFFLLEATLLPRKLRSLPEIDDATWDQLRAMADNVRRYVSLKTIISLCTGALVTVLLWLLGVDNALVMGLLAFMLNFIPSIGSIIAAIPGVLLALLDRGVGIAVWTGVGYLAINVLIGSIIEPRILGKGLGLSPLIVVATMILWAWVLGPVGMLLAVPLTIVVKIALESMDETRSIAIFMGTNVPGEPAPAG